MILPKSIDPRLQHDVLQVERLQLEPAGGGLLPGAGLLPSAIGRRLTIKNVAIGAAVVVGGYIVYAMLSPPKRKPAPAAASKPSTVSGFGWIFGKRWRRKRRRS